jgi:hypothetical protein
MRAYCRSAPLRPGATAVLTFFCGSEGLRYNCFLQVY